jgi:hypothetical protein
MLEMRQEVQTAVIQYLALLLLMAVAAAVLLLRQHLLIWMDLLEALVVAGLQMALLLRLEQAVLEILLAHHQVKEITEVVEALLPVLLHLVAEVAVLALLARQEVVVMVVTAA